MIPEYFATRCGRYVAHIVFHQHVADLLTVEEAEAALARHKHLASMALSDHQSLVCRNHSNSAAGLTSALRIVRNLAHQRAA